MGSRAGPAEVGVQGPLQSRQGPVNPLATVLSEHCTKGMSETAGVTAGPASQPRPLLSAGLGRGPLAAHETMESLWTQSGH